MLFFFWHKCWTYKGDTSAPHHVTDTIALRFCWPFFLLLLPLRRLVGLCAFWRSRWPSAMGSRLTCHQMVRQLRAATATLKEKDKLTLKEGIGTFLPRNYVSEDEIGKMANFQTDIPLGLGDSGGFMELNWCSRIIWFCFSRALVVPNRQLFDCALIILLISLLFFKC